MHVTNCMHVATYGARAWLHDKMWLYGKFPYATYNNLAYILIVSYVILTILIYGEGYVHPLASYVAYNTTHSDVCSFESHNYSYRYIIILT